MVELAATYKVFFPLVNYKADQAIRKLMQMHVTVVQMSLNGPASQKLYVLESMPGADVQRVVKLAEKCLSQSPSETGMSKAILQDLCNLASNESDRLLIKYACCKGQNLPKKKSSALYGFSDFNRQESNINSAISELEEMREAVVLLAKVKDKAVLQGFGLDLSSDEQNSTETCSSTTGTDEDCVWISDNEHVHHGSPISDQENCTNAKEQQRNAAESENASHCLQSHMQSQDPDIALETNRRPISPVPDMEHLLLMLRENNLNWFAFVGELTTLLQSHSEDTLLCVLTDISDHLVNMDLTDEEKKKIEYSRHAYLEYERQKEMHDESRVTDDFEKRTSKF